jgi:hypothetical protein
MPITNKIVRQGNNYLETQFTRRGEAADETDVQKVDISTLAGPASRGNTIVAPRSLKLVWVQFHVEGYDRVELFWERTAANDIIDIFSTGEECRDYERQGGLPDVNVGDGTGDILLSTVGASVAAMYDIYCHWQKKQ